MMGAEWFSKRVGLSGERDAPVDFKPMGVFPGNEFAHAFPRRVHPPGLLFERGVYLQKDIIDGFSVFVEGHIDGAKAFDDGVEQLSITLFGVADLCWQPSVALVTSEASGQFASQFADELALRFGPGGLEFQAREQVFEFGLKSRVHGTLINHLRSTLI